MRIRIPSLNWQFCFGSLADLGARIRDVRFTPKSGHVTAGINVCLVPEADVVQIC